MHYMKPGYFDTFSCVGSDCKDTCCAGWQIVIDEASLNKYKKVNGQIGEQIKKSIDWEQAVFLQKDKRCAMLNESNLCDLYTMLGEDSLCETCKTFPRHVEEFYGVRELSLALSCPIAAKMVLIEDMNKDYLEYDTEEEENLGEEFEDFDFLLYTLLNDARKVFFQILKVDSLCYDQKLMWIISFSKELDKCMETSHLEQMDSIIRKNEKMLENTNMLEKKHYEWGGEERYHTMKYNFRAFSKMELLREKWKIEKEITYKYLYDKEEKEYFEMYQCFCDECFIDYEGENIFKQIRINIFKYFIYLWFCGAVYDEWIHSKVLAAVFCTEYIMDFIMVKWYKEEKKIDLEDVVAVICNLTKEVEHSEENVIRLEEWFR